MINHVLTSIGLVAAAGATGYVGWSFLDTGLANFLALETLRHGTSPVGSAGIHLIGAKPKRPGHGLFGAAKGFDPKRQNYYDHTISEENHTGRYFYAVRSCPAHSQSNDIPRHRAIERLVSRLLPRFYAAIAGSSLTQIYRDSKAIRVVTAIPGVALGMLTPTVQLRFTKAEEEKWFEPDPHSGCDGDALSEAVKAMGVRTPHWFGPWRVGTAGTFFAVIKNPNVFRRIAHNPFKFLTGVFQLMVGLGLTYATYRLTLIAKSTL